MSFAELSASYSKSRSFSPDAPLPSSSSSSKPSLPSSSSFPPPTSSSSFTSASFSKLLKRPEPEPTIYYNTDALIRSSSLDIEFDDHTLETYVHKFITWEAVKMEIWMLVNFAWPVSLSKILWYLLNTVSLIYVGHLATDSEYSSTDYVAGAALGSMFATVTGFSVTMGMVTGIETLCGQANGAGNYNMVGIVLQRAMLLITLACIPLLVIWSQTELILLSLGQEVKIAALAGRYVLYLTPGLWPASMYACLVQYLQCQGIMKPELYVGAVVLGINALVNYILVYVVQMGFNGPPIAYAVSNWSTLIVMLIVMKMGGYHLKTWFGFNLREALRGWGQILWISVPGMLMLCAEWWLFEILNLVAGYFGALQLTALAVVLQIASLEFMLILGLSVGISARVSNLLGAGLPHQAKFSGRCAVAMGCMIVVFNVTLTLLLRDYLGYIFTSDQEAVQLVSDLLPIVATFSFFDGNQGVMCGIIRGMGQQIFGAAINLVGYWLICLPSAILFAFRLNLKSAGLWWGATLGLFIVFCGVSIFLLRVDWQKEADKAAIRTGKVTSSSTIVSDDFTKSHPSVDSTPLLRHADKENPV